MDVERIAEIARQTNCTHVHPGYGFLSESPKLASQFINHPIGGSSATSYGVRFVGPSVETLEIASDKMRSRELAINHGVPVALGTHVSSAEDVYAFVQTNGLPVVIKALDGGGGRGIRLVHTEDEINNAFQRCTGESASGSVFVEKALVGPGWRHVEVQIVGDGRGSVTHLWERECSVQRRFQKVIEMAPSTLPRATVEHLLHAALKMAGNLRYAGLGTVEFLVNGESHQWVFLEINPRIQVEHTVTEEIMNLDLVRVQLLLCQPGASLASALPTHTPSPPPPHGHAIQLRLVAEDPHNAFRLSPGTISPSDVSWPGGRGVRVDTWLNCRLRDSRTRPKLVVGMDFDPLLAKVVVHGGTFQEAASRALRALCETRVGVEVKTNIAVLAGVIVHPDWVAGAVHTRWLEDNLDDVAQLGRQSLGLLSTGDLPPPTSIAGGSISPTSSSNASGTILLQPGASFQLSLSTSSPSQPRDTSYNHTLVLSSIGHNAFPNQLSGTITTSFAPVPLSFSLTQHSSISTSVQYEMANPQEVTHVGSPLSGKIVELHPGLAAAIEGTEAGRHVNAGDPLAVISVMKMENVVNAPASGEISRVGKGIEVGAIIGEGALLNMANASFMDEIRKIPPVTRFLCASSLAVTLPVLLQILPIYKVLFVKEYVTKKFEIWRVFTSFFLGSSGINFIFDIAML
ncbi:hypothetical protein BC628DRAFT_1409940 [Trametes gibbosa]|nr:hypothetical protein BC628DRAFT_1409940 [Trametes gibbosa]